MQDDANVPALTNIVLALNEAPIFALAIRSASRPASRSATTACRSICAARRGTVEAVIEPAGVDNEEEGYGRNAGAKRHYYRIAIPMTEIWPDYAGSPRDGLRIEVFETWLERI